MEEREARPINAGNPAHAYGNYLLRLASKVANNLGFAQAERGDWAAAAETWPSTRHGRQCGSAPSR